MSKADLEDHGGIPDSVKFVTKTAHAREHGVTMSTVNRWIEKRWLPEPVLWHGKHGWWADDLKRYVRKATKRLDPNRDRTMRGPRGEDVRRERVAADPGYLDALADDDPEFAEFLAQHRAEQAQARAH